MTRGVLAGVFAVAAGGLLAAADPADDRKPVPGPFRAFVVADERYDKGSTRNRAGRVHDLVTDAALNPQVAVFARAVPAAADAPLARLVGRLNALVLDRRADRLGAFVAFLTLGKEYPEEEGRDAKADEVRRLAEQLKVPNVPLAVAAGKSDAATGWELSDAAELTVVFVNRMKVVQRWEFTADKPLDDAAVKAVEEAVNKELGKKAK